MIQTASAISRDRPCGTRVHHDPDRSRCSRSVSRWLWLVTTGQIRGDEPIRACAWDHGPAGTGHDRGFSLPGKPRGQPRSSCRSTRTTKPRWSIESRTVEKAGMALWPWIEVGTKPGDGRRPPRMDGRDRRPPRRLAAAIPRRPDRPSRGEVIKAWPWVPIGYAPAFDAHRMRLKSLLGDLREPGRGCS